MFVHVQLNIKQRDSGLKSKYENLKKKCILSVHDLRKSIDDFHFRFTYKIFTKILKNLNIFDNVLVHVKFKYQNDLKDYKLNRCDSLEKMTGDGCTNIVKREPSRITVTQVF